MCHNNRKSQRDSDTEINRKSEKETQRDRGTDIETNRQSNKDSTPNTSFSKSNKQKEDNQNK